MANADERALSGNRDFLLLWLGQCGSAIGSQVSAIAFPLLVLGITGSPLLAGVVTSAQLAATLVGRLPAGVAVDRCDRRRLMVWCDLLRAVGAASVVGAHALGHLTFGHLVVVAFLEGLLTSVFQLAEAAALVRVVDRRWLGDAVALNEARGQAATLLGPLVGGILFSIGATLPFAFDALTYVISMACVMAIGTTLTEPSARRVRPRLVADSAAGLTWLWRNAFLRDITLWVSGVNLVFSALGLVVVVLAQDRGASPTGIGVMFAITGAGGILGAVAAAPLQKRLPPAVLVLAFGCLSTGAAALLTTASSSVALGVLGAVAFFAVPIVNTVMVSHVLCAAPEELRGRAINSARLVIGMASPLGPLSAGALLTALAPANTVLVYSALLGALTAAAAVSGSIRGAKRPLNPDDATGE